MANFDYNPSNDQTYQKILNGYKQQQYQFDQQSAGIDQGYQQMISDNQGYGASQQQALRDQYDQNTAQAQQSAISRGLYNTGILDSAQRGNNLDYAKAGLTLNDQLIQRQQGLQQARLGYASQAQQQSAALAGQGLAAQTGLFQQQYGAGANYVSQYDLANQQAGLARGQTGYNYDLQQQLGKTQQNYALQTMAAQNANQVNYANQFGYS
jgi:hypothetical protein